MRVNVQTDYALRLLMTLAAAGDRLTTIAAVAQRWNISKNHLMKVANTMTSAGIVEAVRGRYGGLRLARQPAAISVGEVVRLTESDFAIVECFQDSGSDCLVSRVCRLKRVLNQALESFLQVLDDTTLEDLTTGNQSMLRLLRPHAGQARRATS